MDEAKIFLKENEEKRILAGEFWAYDNEIATPLDSFEPGQITKLYSAQGKYIGTGYVNPHSIITFRLLTRHQDQVIDRDFIKQRILLADRQRQTIEPENHYYRMVYGEADFMPGLVIDRFDDYLIVQITTAGMENLKEIIFSVVLELFPGSILIEKSLNTAREKEKLPLINQVISQGKKSKKKIQINSIYFNVDFLKSQKTGFFLDQRENYLLLKGIAKGKTVLDAFSYAGAWGLHAYFFGARFVTFLEISSAYLQQTEENIKLNCFPIDSFSFIQDDAIKRLKVLSKQDHKQDIIILDPPAFVKSRHKVREAMRGYKEINLRALKMLAENSFLITCSCSHFLEQDDFIEVIFNASQDAGRRIKLIEFRTQPYDHAVLFPLSQSAYLKCALFYVY